MVCKICEEMLCERKGWTISGIGPDYLTFPLHRTEKEFRETAEAGCYLCSVVHDKLESLNQLGETKKGQSRSFSAALSTVDAGYRLDFKLGDTHQTIHTHQTVASFILTENGNQGTGSAGMHFSSAH